TACATSTTLRWCAHWSCWPITKSRRREIHNRPMSTAHENPRAFLRALYDAAVARALPGEVIGRFLPAPPKGRTLVLGAGKAGGAMAAAVDALWPKDAPLSGLIVTRYDHVPPA